MKKDENVIIKRSDKCKNIVIMDKPDYISKAEQIVSSYDIINKNPTTKLEEDTKTLMKTTLQGKIPDDCLRKILPQHSRTAEFYGLPKTHKTGNPLRPIVSACGDPLDKLSWFLQRILTQILAFIPHHVLTNNYLRFNSKIFKQTSGIAMGNRLAPPVAIAFMHAFETSLLSRLSDIPIFYVRYIDDILGVWTYGINRLNHFFNLMNTHNPAIRLTIEHTGSSGGTLAFLDTLITVRPSGTYTTELYFKPMTAPIILHYSSAHPMSTKKAVLNAEVQRAIRVSSDQQTRERSLSAVTQLFVDNGYPLNIIKRTITNNTHRTNAYTRKPKKDNNTSAQIFMRLPYINETIVRRANGILRGAKAP